MKGAIEVKIKAQMKFNDLKRMLISEKKADPFKSFKEKSSIKDKIFEGLWFPFHWTMKLTIPPCDAEHYDKYMTIIWPWLGLPSAYMICFT